MKRYAIIGGGLAGLLAARSLRLESPEAEIHIFERNQECGGLLRGDSYKHDTLYFDKGTHIFQETGITEIDQFILNAIKPQDLLHFDIGQGDLSGAVFSEVFQENSHFPDLRNNQDFERISSSIKQYIEEGEEPPEFNRFAPLIELSHKRFGSQYTESILAPLLAKMYQYPADELAGLSMLLPGLTRVIATDLNNWHKCSDNELFRSIFAIPDQQQLPSELQHTRRSFYSRQNGTKAFIDGIVSELANDGVNFENSATINSFSLKKKNLTWTNINGVENNLDADGVVIAIGVVGAALMLGENLADFGFERPMPHYLLNIVLDDLTQSDLFYFYGLDHDTDYYRVTNYRGFSGNPQDKRITIEVIGKRTENDQDLIPLILEQLHKAGFLKNTKHSFSDVIKLGAGFPAPTIKNLKALNDLWEHLDAKLPSWVVLGGIGSNGGRFFQNEIILDIYKRAKLLV